MEPRSLVCEAHSAIEGLFPATLRELLASSDESDTTGKLDVNLCYDPTCDSYNTVSSRTCLGRLLQAVLKRQKPFQGLIVPGGAEVETPAPPSASGKPKPSEAICKALLRFGADPLLPIHPPVAVSSADGSSTRLALAPCFLQAVTNRLLLPGALQGSARGGTNDLIDELAAMFTAALEHVTASMKESVEAAAVGRPMSPFTITTATLVAWCLSGRRNAVQACLNHLKATAASSVKTVVDASYKVPSFGLFSPLTAAVYSQSLSVVRLVAEDGHADPNLQPKLCMRVLAEHEATADETVKKGATSTAPPGACAAAAVDPIARSALSIAGGTGPADTALMWAIQLQNVAIVQYLLFGDGPEPALLPSEAAPAVTDEDPKAANVEKVSAAAAEPAASSPITFITTTTKARADPNVPRLDSTGATPLVVACTVPLHSADSLEIVRLLLLAGADVNKTDKVNTTPLHAAVQSGCYELVDLLIEAGARGTG